MKIAVTGATGFLGRYIVRHLLAQGHECRCWFRAQSDRSDLPETGIEWVSGELSETAAAAALVVGCDAVVHAALDRPNPGFRGVEGDIVEYAERNIVGTLRLIEAAKSVQVGRFVFISTCAVHERILDDRPLDEAHPTWATSHYGAHKAAVENFVHSYGWGHGFPICAVRPTGVYGVARPVEASKWYPLIHKVVSGQSVDCTRGGKEVHVHDVARAVELLLHAEGTDGECFNCYDYFVSEFEVAQIAQKIAGSNSRIVGVAKQPKSQIATDKLQSLGMAYGGTELLRGTVESIVKYIQSDR